MLLLATGLMTAYGYFAEVFSAYYGGDKYELDTLRDRLCGRLRVELLGRGIL